MICRGIPVLLIRLFKYWYTMQLFCVRWANAYSDKFGTINGVRQGGIISPILFNLYMDDLSITLNNAQIGCSINGQLVNHLLYADDTCIIAPSPGGLQKLLDICCTYAEVNTILFNDKKTKCMCFKPRSLKHLNVPPVFLCDTELKFVTDIKYLGIFLNADMTDHDDMNRHVRYLYAKGNMLLQKFKNCSDNVKFRLFTTYCNSFYGGHLWTVYKPAQLDKVCVAFNNVFRMLFSIKRGVSISNIYVTNNIDSLTVLVRKAAFHFRNRLLKSENVLVKSFINSVHFILHSSFKKLWNNILFA